MMDAKRLARAMPIGLASYCDPDFELTPLARLENDLWLDAYAGTLDRVFVVAPPQHGKTTLSQYAIPWWIGNRPTTRFMTGSYALDLAKRTGREVRDILEIHGEEVFGVHVRDDTSKASDWQTTQGGGLFSGGRQGGFTGRGAGVAYLDDLFKNQDEAESQAVQEEARRFLDVTISTRLGKGGVIFVTNTRWSEEDVAGHILRTQRERWTMGKGRFVRVPAIADGLDVDGKPGADGLPSFPDPVGRRIGEPLWPRKFPLDVLEDRRRTQGPYVFDTVYQGLPRPAAGFLFKRGDFRYWSWADPERTTLRLHRAVGDVDIPFVNCQVAAFMDTAATDEIKPGADPDWTAISVWAFTPTGDMVLLDVVRARVDTTQHEVLYDDVRRRWRHCMVHVEKAHTGLNLIQGLARRGRPVAAVEVDRNKVSRARALHARYALHAVYHPDPRAVPEAASWLPAWEDEVVAFPKGRHDDQVDTGSMAAGYEATWANPGIRSVDFDF